MTLSMKLRVAVAAAAVLLVGAPGARANDQINCKSWWMPPTTGGRVAHIAYWPDNGGPSQILGKGAPVIMLRYGEIKGIQHAWAQMGRARPGDWITLDISNDGGKTWGYCGPYKAGNQTFVTAAARTSKDPKVKMRACGAPAGVPGSRALCTKTW
jgi:hypothetical protein